MLIVQTFFNFEFISVEGQFRKLRRSACGATVIMVYVIVGQISFLIVQEQIFLTILNFSSVFMIFLFKFKDEHLTEITKLIELSFLMVNKTGIILLNLNILLGHQISLPLYFMVILVLVASTLMMNTYSLEFEILNINKWPTSDIKIKYNDNLRSYLSRK